MHDQYFHWNFDPVLVKLGPLEIRYYGLCFVAGLLLASANARKLVALRGLSDDHLQRVTLWIFVGLIVGAHWVHLIFYEPYSIIYNPVRIVEFGSGLASHGGGLGAILALYAYCRKHKLSFYEYADPLIVGATWVFSLVRLGNFFNSEIYGTTTTLPWGVIFERHGFTEPRHPSQLYEFAMGLLLVISMNLFYRRFHRRVPVGFTFYLTMACYFTLRFLVEYVKEHQVFSPNAPLDMGQILSLPIVVVSVIMMARLIKRPPTQAPSTPTAT